jgi:anti-sigma factor RsiW
MNCNEAATVIAGYADGEVDSARGRSIEDHLRSCATCTARHQEVLALRARIRAELPYFAAPPALQERLRAAAAREVSAQHTAGAPRSAERSRFRWLTGGALAGCTATVVAFVLGTFVIDWRANEDIAMQAAATHVRATLGNRLIEVASSDQHTVKPWLSSRLDYSPPVRDFASDGFALIGARLETLDKQRVATLVYRYRQHTIDVFVRPDSAHAPTGPRTVRGFNVAHATGSGMDWLAVSDVGPDVLSAFVQQLAQESNAR